MAIIFQSKTLNLLEFNDTTGTLIVKLPTGNNNNLQQWQDSSGTVLAQIQSTGAFNTSWAGSFGTLSNLSSTTLGVVALNSTIVPLVAKGAASQTANLQEWQNSAGTVLAKVTKDGDVFSGGLISNGMTSGYTGADNVLNNLGIQASSFGLSYFRAKSGFAGAIVAVIDGATSQTGDLTQWRNSAGTVLAKFSAYGDFIIPDARVAIGASSVLANTFIFANTSYASYTPIVVRGAASQTADLQQWQNSGGSVLLNVDSTGSLDIGAGSNNIWKIKNQTSTVMEWQPGQGFCFFPYGSSNKPLTIKGTVSQSANLTEWRNSAETVIASISPTGKLTSAVDASINGVVIGMGAGSASTNTSVGLNSLVSNTTGTYNTAFGNQSLQLNTSGTQNTAFGQNALYNNRTGWYNTAFGQGALQNNNYAYSNTAIGVAAMINNISGSGNTAVGIQSLLLNSSGGNNVGIGQNAGFSNSTGSGNIFLGSEAGYYETGSNKLYIANTNTTTPLIGGDFSAKTLTFAGNATITSQTTGTVGLVVKGAASQTANLQEWQNSSGTLLSAIDKAGNLTKGDGDQLVLASQIFG